MTVRGRVYEFCHQRQIEPPVNLVEYTEWLKQNYPNENAAFERRAAKIYNEMHDDNRDTDA
jgi:hypothetical protein